MATRSAVIVALALQGASAFLTRGGPSPRALRARSAGRMAAKMQVSPSPMAQNVMDFSKEDPYAFTACILGDLHIDPRYMGASSDRYPELDGSRRELGWDRNGGSG